MDTGPVTGQQRLDHQSTDDRHRILTSNLTQRYVDAVLRYLPASQRTPAGNDLRARITNSIRGQGPGTQDPQQSEYTVLTQLGEPAHMAASYAKRPLGMIGPTIYLQYIRALKVLFAVVLPLVVIGVIALDLADGMNFTDGILSGLLRLPGVAAQLFVVITIAFVILERLSSRSETHWTPEELPQSASPTTGSSFWPALSVAWDLALLSVIIWQYFAAPYTLTYGTQVPILNPDLFQAWIWPILIGLTGVLALDLIRAARHRWSLTLAGTYSAVTALFALPLAWVFSQQMIFDQRFLTDFNQGWTTPDQFYTLIALVILVIAAGSCIESVRAALNQSATNDKK